MQGLLKLAERFPIIDVRGRGLMVAAEFGSADGGYTAKPGTASAVTKACAARDMLLLSAGMILDAKSWQLHDCTYRM